MFCRGTWRPLHVKGTPRCCPPNDKSVPHKALHSVHPAITHRVTLITLVRFRNKTLVFFGCIQARITSSMFQEKIDDVRRSLGKHQRHLSEVTHKISWIGSGTDVMLAIRWDVSSSLLDVTRMCDQPL